MNGDSEKQEELAKIVGSVVVHPPEKDNNHHDRLYITPLQKQATKLGHSPAAPKQNLHH
ncbi:hypothetical protein TSUD_149340 [Trifolium subterraneum]|uniref:Uncharacterized protein n=1 Tax=Trifolium subterraneum TaxID=3900 RepID=A0A2Z6MH43_TRISU|nr:hypothetical protein TSUD_149340 [Trifolium subterraneum]